MLLVTGMTVTTPRCRRAAVALAWSLLTMIAGRRLAASFPSTGSRSTSRTSPRSIVQPVAHGDFPRLALAGRLPLLPRRGVVLAQIGVAQQTHGVLQCGRSRSQSGRPDVLVQGGDVFVGQADAQLHDL